MTNRNIILAVIFTAIIAMVVMYFPISYTTSLNNDDGCHRHWKSPGDVAELIASENNICKIIGKGSYHDSAFFHLQCKVSQNDGKDRFVFGTMESCASFKELSGIEYIQLHLSTVLPEHAQKFIPQEKDVD